MRLTVACVLWMGEFENRHYSPAWVTRLRDQVAACLPIPHRFVCLSNVDVPGVETQPLVTDWPGWWAQLEVFNPAQNLGDRVLYLDLDVFVTGDLTPIVEWPAPMAFMPPSHLFSGQPARDLPGVIRKYQASCSVFSPPAGRELFEDCGGPASLPWLRSSQDWIGWKMPDLPTLPPVWFRKSQQCRSGVPDGVKLVLAQRVDIVGKTLAEVA